jgi:hypothetical protein
MRLGSCDRRRSALRLPQESAARAKGYSADDRARLDDLIERVDR